MTSPTNPAGPMVHWYLDPKRFDTATQLKAVAAAEALNAKAGRTWTHWVPYLALGLLLGVPGALGYRQVSFGALLGLWLLPVIVLLAKRRHQAQVVEQLDGTPGAGAPSTATATPQGLHLQGPGLEQWASWIWTRSTTVAHDHLVITSKGGPSTALPFAAVTTGQSPDEVVAIVSSWITDAAMSNGATVPGWTGTPS